jgi:hypothetical protein
LQRDLVPNTPCWQQGMVSSQECDKSGMCIVIYLTPMKRVHSWRVMESSLRSHVYIERKASQGNCGWKSKSIQWYKMKAIK